MSLLRHIHLMAKYNTRMNRQVFQAAVVLSPSELAKNRKAFFGSILGTLNHIMVGDIIWLNRFLNHFQDSIELQKITVYPKPASLNQLLYSNFNELAEKRVQIDELIINWCKELNQKDLSTAMTYHNMKGIQSTRNVGELVLHFFNHQTHHRGQVSTLLSQCGIDIGITDFLIDIPDKNLIT